MKKKYFQVKGPCVYCLVCYLYNGKEIGSNQLCGIPEPPLHENCMCVAVEMSEVMAKGMGTHECACDNKGWFWVEHGEVVICNDCGRSYIGHQEGLDLRMLDITEYGVVKEYNE